MNNRLFDPAMKCSEGMRSCVFCEALTCQHWQICIENTIKSNELKGRLRADTGAYKFIRYIVSHVPAILKIIKRYVIKKSTRKFKNPLPRLSHKINFKNLSIRK